MRTHGPSGAGVCAALLLLLVGTASAAPLPRRPVRPRSSARAAALLHRGGAWPDGDGDYGTEAPAPEWEEEPAPEWNNGVPPPRPTTSALLLTMNRMKVASLFALLTLRSNSLLHLALHATTVPGASDKLRVAFTGALFAGNLLAGLRLLLGGRHSLTSSERARSKVLLSVDSLTEIALVLYNGARIAQGGTRYTTREEYVGVLLVCWCWCCWRSCCCCELTHCASQVPRPRLHERVAGDGDQRCGQDEVGVKCGEIALQLHANSQHQQAAALVEGRGVGMRAIHLPRG